MLRVDLKVQSQVPVNKTLKTFPLIISLPLERVSQTSAVSRMCKPESSDDSLLRPTALLPLLQALPPLPTLLRGVPAVLPDQSVQSASKLLQPSACRGTTW